MQYRVLNVVNTVNTWLGIQPGSFDQIDTELCILCINLYIYIYMTIHNSIRHIYIIRTNNNN